MDAGGDAPAMEDAAEPAVSENPGSAFEASAFEDPASAFEAGEPGMPTMVRTPGHTVFIGIDGVIPD